MSTYYFKANIIVVGNGHSSLVKIDHLRACSLRLVR